jgi:hypothetical protein
MGPEWSVGHETGGSVEAGPAILNALWPLPHPLHRPWAGGPGLRFLDDLYSFDPATMAWTLLSAAPRPAARSNHGFASAGGKLYVHGGFGFNGSMAGIMMRALKRSVGIRDGSGDSGSG